VDRFNRKAYSKETAVSQLMVICEGLKRYISKYGVENQTFNNEVASSSADKVVNSDNSVRDSFDGLDKT
jgi:hypothetical protein